jgi:hypothetical protein
VLTYVAPLVSLLLIYILIARIRKRDYFFHPSNEKHLAQLLRNLASSHLYYASSDLLEDLPEAIKIVKEQLKDADKYSTDDRALLQGAHDHLCRAYNDPDWRWTMLHEGVGYRAQGLPHTLGSPWADIQPETDADQCVLFGEKVTALRRALYECSRIDKCDWEDEEDLLEELVTAGMRSHGVVKRRLQERKHLSSKLKRDSRKSRGSTPNNNNTESKSKVVTGQLNGPVTPRGVRSRDTRIVATKPLPVGSSLRSAALLGSTSPKLDYITEQILSHPSDKFLIFVPPGRNEAYWIGEACELRGIKVRSGQAVHRHLVSPSDSETLQFLYYVSEGLNHERRTRYLATFQNSDAFQVLIMSLNLSARGLNVTAASRVIFVEPCWQPDIQVRRFQESMLVPTADF